MFKYFAFDLDGTLLSSNKKIESKTLKKLHALNIENNKYIILVSGRHISEMAPYIKALNLNSNCFYISSDGQYIYDGALNLMYVAPHIEKQSLEILLKRISTKCAIVVTKTGDYLVETNWWKYWIRQIIGFIKVNSQNVYYSRNIMHSDISEIEKIIVFSSRCESLKDSFNVHILDNGRTELLNKNVNKFYALKYLSDGGWIDLDKLLYFGDDMNDYECFEMIDNTVAMGNAAEAIKRLAKFQTEDCDHHGVLNALSRIENIYL